ncbi:MAG: tRNA epoxyqueuosine(34) reductase QueG [Planctomycetota bacterium]|nr:tRNA epoxyqueuosine(34) reductase QueG [Planctomycetota bacterium]
MVLRACADEGFSLAGVAPVQPSRWAAHVREWLASGKHGSMSYLAEELQVRLDPGRVMEGTRAFVVVGDRYAARGGADAPQRGQGRIARYARGKNYHEVMKQRLHRVADRMRVRFPGSDFRTCVDTAPLPERELAFLAGLGWIGRNTMVIHPQGGSYLLLGVMATNLELEPASRPMDDHCGTCTRCIEACPTGAITAYSVDASRCISYLTIERRGLVPPDLHAGIGDWIFGCDVCQEVCPHNSARAGQGDDAVHSAYRSDRRGLDLLAVLGWDESARREAFRSSAMKRASLAIMKRNALIAAGNVVARGPEDDLSRALRERIAAIAAGTGEEEMVTQTARAVLDRLAGSPPGG